MEFPPTFEDRPTARGGITAEALWLQEVFESMCFGDWV